MFLAVTSDTWIVTGLGFGIVLALLICLVFILMFFGYIMQKVQPKKQPIQPKTQQGAPAKAKTTDEAEIAAVAIALYLNEKAKSDPNISMIKLNNRETAWSPKSNGFNNVGF